MRRASAPRVTRREDYWGGIYFPFLPRQADFGSIGKVGADCGWGGEGPERARDSRPGRILRLRVLCLSRPSAEKSLIISERREREREREIKRLRA